MTSRAVDAFRKATGPIRDVSAIQDRVLELAAQTARLRADCLDLVAELNRDHLPRGPDERMAEDDVAPSVPFYLAGLLDVVESDHLSEVEDDLREAAEMTAADLAREFDQERPGT